MIGRLTGFSLRTMIAAIFTVVVVAVPAPVWAVTATLSGSPVDNYLRNSSFVDDEFWIIKGEQTHFDADGGHRGGGIVMSDAGNGAEVIQTVGPILAPGQRYTLSARVRALSDGSTAVIGVRWDGAYPRVFRGVDPADGWVRMEFHFEAPTTPGWRQVVLSGAGDLAWDDVTLHEADTLEARLAQEWEALIAAGEPVYTGLVVNGAGTPLERGMSPRIYDEDGQLIFAGMGAGDGQLFSQGLVAYTRDLQQGVAHPRLKASDAYVLRLPLIVDVQATAGFPVTDAIIGRADAALIRQAVETYDFLGRFAVVFVVDPWSGL